MSPSPLTPSKGNQKKDYHAAQMFLGSNERAASSSKSKLNFLNEPSPASTYGETAESSMPATPFNPDGPDITTEISHSLRAAQLDPAIKSISGSPMPSHEQKYRPSNSQNAAQPSRGNEHSSPLKPVHGVNAAGTTSPTPTPPSSGRAQAIRTAPSWRGGHQSSFVHQTGSQEDDPFVSNEEASRPQMPQQCTTLGYHPNKIGVTPTNNTAQAIFPPQACVFVANLMQSETDEQLEYAVTEAFQRFGDVYIKIRRDSRQMPFAFAQYTNVEDAQRAITMGRGMLINGRPCRTEVARVNRSLYLSKTQGGPVSEGEAREMLNGHGPLESVWSASQTEREMFGLPEGVFVRFAFFDDCRDAQMGFRDSASYRLEQVKGFEDSRNALAASPWQHRSPGLFAPAPSLKRNVEARSVFVGGLPSQISDDHLTNLFQMYGRVMRVEIIRKPSIMNASGVNVFAFVEFDNVQSTNLAVQASRYEPQNLPFRVEHKEHSNPPRSFQSSSGSPRQGAVHSPQDLSIAFQRGISFGMSQALQAQVVVPPMYPQYQYYPSFDPRLVTPNAPAATSGGNSATSPQVISNGFMDAIAAQFSGSPSSVSYGHFTEQHPYVAPNPVISNYQWPVATSQAEESNVSNASNAGNAGNAGNATQR